MKHEKAKTVKESAWVPFQYPVFKMMWISSVVSSIGTWMQDVGVAWLMTSLTKDPFLVAAVQAMTAFAMFLWALPAGALADIIDRRRYLIILQTGLMLAAGILSVITYFGFISPKLLLFMTFCLGTGAAFSFPAWVALMSELVPSKHLAPAVTLTGVSINISRSIGPALAGFIIAAAGPFAVFALNSLSFFGIIVVLKGWKRKSIESALPTERLFGAMRAGLRYTWGSPSFQTVLIKACGFFVFASGTWALLPLITRVKLHGGPIEFGVLLALLGFGAVLGAMILPYFRQRFNCDQLILGGAIGFAITTFMLALSNHFYTSCGAMILGGLSWTAVLATLTTLVQQVVPVWVRARAISIFFAVFFGGMALGSLIWGGIATHFSIEAALICAAIFLIFSNFLTSAFATGRNLILDHTPSNRSPPPILEEQPRYEEGPVMVLIEYTVEQNNFANFIKAIRDLRQIRLRDGAFFWSLFKDVNNPTKLVECFMVESWLDHLRQHERMSNSDWEIQEKVYSFNQGKVRPQVTHFIAHNLKREH